MKENRKLAAILAADVVGFSRLTGVDEDRFVRAVTTLTAALIANSAGAQPDRDAVIAESPDTQVKET